MSSSAPALKPPSGLGHAIGAYLIWGVLPLYFALVSDVPPLEMVAMRILATLPLCLALVAWGGLWPELRGALADPRTLATLAASAVLIAANWLIYVFAVTGGHVLAASLGYYINPLVNVLAGTVFLGERLSGRQWLAVAMAAVGVAVLAQGAADMLWISLALALTFCSYGLVRKLVRVEALPGLTVETMLLFVPALVVEAYFALGPTGSALGQSPLHDLAIAAAGPVTGIPLIMFATAARRMSYSALGFVQYLAPTILFVLSLTVFAEPLRPVQLASFALIWSAIALFCLDLLLRSRRRAASTAASAERG